MGRSVPKMNEPLRTLHIRTSPLDSKLQLISQGCPLGDGRPPLYSIYHGEAGKRKAVLYYGEVNAHDAIGDMAISLYTSTSKLSVRGRSISLKVNMRSGDFLVDCPAIGILTWKGYKHMPHQPLELEDKSGVCLARFVCEDEEAPKLELMRQCDEWLTEAMLLSSIAVFELHKKATGIIPNGMLEKGVEAGTEKIVEQLIIGAFSG